MGTTERRTPPVNATLTEVRRRLPNQSMSDPTEWDIVWRGSAPAFATNRVERPANFKGVLHFDSRTLVIPDPLPLVAEVRFTDSPAPDDALFYTRGNEEAFLIIDEVEDRSDLGFLRCFGRQPHQ